NSGVEDVQVAFEQDNVGSVLGDVHGSRDGHTDVRRVDGGRVVDAVAQEADDVVATLEREDDPVFLRGRDAGKDGRVLSYRSESAVGHALDLVATDDAGTVEADLTADVLDDKLVVAGEDLHLDAVAAERAECLGDEVKILDRKSTRLNSSHVAIS